MILSKEELGTPTSNKIMVKPRDQVIVIANQGIHRKHINRHFWDGYIPIIHVNLRSKKSEVSHRWLAILHGMMGSTARGNGTIQLIFHIAGWLFRSSPYKFPYFFHRGNGTIQLCHARIGTSREFADGLQFQLLGFGGSINDTPWGPHFSETLSWCTH